MAPTSATFTNVRAIYNNDSPGGVRLQRLSVAVQLSVAQEAAEALGLSVAADPRAR